jgi:hypothetical protein
MATQALARTRIAESLQPRKSNAPLSYGVEGRAGNIVLLQELVNLMPHFLHVLRVGFGEAPDHFCESAGLPGWISRFEHGFEALQVGLVQFWRVHFYW